MGGFAKDGPPALWHEQKAGATGPLKISFQKIGVERPIFSFQISLPLGFIGVNPKANGKLHIGARAVCNFGMKKTCEKMREFTPEFSKAEMISWARCMAPECGAIYNWGCAV